MKRMFALLIGILWGIAPGFGQKPRQPIVKPKPRPGIERKSGPPQPAPAQKVPSAMASPTRTAALAEATGVVLQETSEIRQLAVLKPVPSAAQTRAEIEQSLIADLDATPAEIRANELLYRKLGLTPPDFQLRAFFLRLLTEQVAGYYDIRAGRFYLADWIGIDQQRPVMAHELAHALQDQHFNLRRFLDTPPAGTDARLAVNALIEGDAMLVMRFYATRNPLRALNYGRAAQMQSPAPTFAAAPRIVREPLVFPYQAGLLWASYLYERGGWPALTQAFTDLPQSSEQIMHPEKYVAREAPVAVDLPDISKQLGTGWRRIWLDTRGEWSYYLLLDEFLKDEAVSRAAAAGWGGDRCAVYEHAKTGQVAVAQISAWDTEKDAQEFFAAYTRRTSARFGLEAKTLSATQLSWNTPAGVINLTREGVKVLAWETVPQRGKETAKSN